MSKAAGYHRPCPTCGVRVHEVCPHCDAPWPRALRRSFGSKADEAVDLLRLMRRRLRLRPHVRRRLSSIARELETLAYLEQHGSSSVLRDNRPTPGEQLGIPGADHDD